MKKESPFNRLRNVVKTSPDSDPMLKLILDRYTLQAQPITSSTTEHELDAATAIERRIANKLSMSDGYALVRNLTVLSLAEEIFATHSKESDNAAAATVASLITIFEASPQKK